MLPFIKLIRVQTSIKNCNLYALTITHYNSALNASKLAIQVLKEKTFKGEMM